MRISAAQPTDAGFTLTELMIVVMLIGLAATAVVLTLPASGASARSEASRFAARVAALRDLAIIEGRPLGLWATASGYGFEQRRAGGWQPLEGGAVRAGDWASGTAVAVDGSAQGRLHFDRLGLPDAPMRVELTSGATQALVTISPAGEVSVQ